MEATAATKETTEYAPGTFCWVELGTTDAAGAKSFYTQLFGWGHSDLSMGAEGVYTMLQVEGKDVAALYQLTEQQRNQGVPPHWLLYVSVASADESARAAAMLGAKVIMKPFDVYDVGRMAIIQDPTGPTLALWQARKHAGAAFTGRPNTLCWHELVTKDAEAAETFYTRLFGWTSEIMKMEPAPYTVFKQGDTLVGGMLKMTEEWGDVPPHWMTYFAVADCDRTAEQARALGADIKCPPTDIPDVGRFALIHDPQGAVFSIIQLTEHA